MRERAAGSGLDQAAGGSRVQRPECQSLDVGTGEGHVPGAVPGIVADPAREQKPDRLVTQAPEREGERLRRRRVEPLDVVDGDQQRTLAGDAAQEIEERDADGVRIRWPGGRPGVPGRGILPKEGDAERPGLRAGQPFDRRVVDRLEEVPDGRVGERRFGIGRPGDEGPTAGLGGPIDSRLPERGLAHAGLGLDDEADRPASRAGKPVLDHRELACSADDDLVQGTHDCRPTTDHTVVG